jgi:hypothetical protein
MTMTRGRPTYVRALLAITLAAAAVSCHSQEQGCELPALPEVAVKATNGTPSKPPLVVLGLDVTLRNRSAGPRWFLLPDNLPPSEGVTGVDGVEVLGAKGTAHVVLSDFTGSKGFEAILLPAEANLVLHGVGLDYWSDEPDADTKTVDYTVIVATDLRIGDQSARDFMGVDPLCDNVAEATLGHTIASYETPDLKEVPVTVTEDHRVTVQLDVSDVYGLPR